MKLILRDYIATLNERPQLSSLLTDLLPLMGYRMERLDFRGVSQYGIDLAASKLCANNKRILYIFVVKQGNIDKGNWDKDSTSVRQTMHNIIDVPFKDLTKPELRNIKRKIIIVHNGDLHPNISPNLEGIYRTLKKRRFDCERWDLGQLTDFVAEYLITDRLFKNESQSDLRQALAFLEIEDYDLKHYKNIVSKLISQLSTSNLKKFSRFICQIKLLILILYSQALRNKNNLNYVLEACEFSILKTFAWLCQNGKEKDKKWGKYLVDLWILQTEIALKILDRFKHLLKLRDGISLTGDQEVIEYPLRTFRLIGMLSYQIILLRTFNYKVDNKKINKLISNLHISLQNVIVNMSASKRPLLNNFSIEIILGILALHIMGDYKTEADWIREILNWLVFRKRTGKLLPEGHSNIELVIEAEATGKKPQYYVDSASTLITTLFELCILLNLNKTYQEMRKFFAKTNSDLQMLYPSNNFWDWIFHGKPTNHIDEGDIETSIILPKTLKKFKEEITERFIKFDLPYERRLNHDAVLLMTLLSCKYYKVLIPPYFWRKLFIQDTKKG